MRWPLAAAACLLAVTAEAQVYRFRTHSSATGLSNNAIYAVFQDSQGYVWFATDGGACRYDGASYRSFSVPQGLVDASVRGFVEDDQGRLWVVTKGGLSRFDGRRFTSFTRAEGLVHDEVRSGTRGRDGTLWFGTSQGISRWDGQRFSSLGAAEGLPPGPVWALHEDHRRRLWVGLRGGGLAWLEGSRFHVLSAADGLPEGVNSVFSIAEDPEGRLWLASNTGVLRYDGARFERFGRAQGLRSEDVSSVLVDRLGRVWCGTFGGGIARLEAGRFTTFDRRHGLPDDYLTSVFSDREGNIWFGSLFSGAFRFVSERFATFDSAWGLGDGLITGIARSPDGAMWFSSINSGLTRRDPSGATRRFTTADGLVDDHLWTAAVDSRGRVWTGGLKGVSVREGDRFRNFPIEELAAHDRINAIAEDGAGRVWLGSGAARSSGIVAWDGRGFRTFTTEDGLAHHQVNSFGVDRQGRLWVCTEDGVSRLDGAPPATGHDPRLFTTWRLADGLPSKRALVMHEDPQGTVWIGTPAGLVRFDGRSFTTFTTREGLVNDYVSSLTSQGGRLWVGTGSGISAYDGSSFANYTVRDGLLSHEIATAAALAAPDGSVWFGSAAGAVRHLPIEPTTVDLPPHVLIRSVRARDRYLDWSRPVSLPHDDNNLSIEFLGLSFVDEEAIRYSYAMAGFEEDWSEPDAARSVRFLHLPPGSYRFLVRARSAGGLWSAPASLAFEIRPAFWQSGWFHLALVLGLAGAGWALYAWRTRALHARNLERIAGLRQLLDSIRVINSGLDLDSVLQNIVAEAARLVDAEPGAIGLLRGEELRFHRVWVDGAWQPSELSVGRGEGVAGEVARTGEARVVDDPGGDPGPGLPAAFPESYARGFIDVPITDRTGTVVGVLDVRRRPGQGPFGEDDRHVLQSLAHQAAIAIENARLFGDLEEKKIMLSESVWAVEELYKNEVQTSRILQEMHDMKTNFMVVTSHEMRTPLTILKGHHEALLGGFLGEITASQRNTLEICRRSIERLITSFNGIIEMLKIDQQAPLDPQPLDLCFEVEQVLSEIRPLSERRGQSLVLERGGELPLVVADSAKMQLAFANLVQNAVKFTPDGGTVRVRLTAEPEGVHAVVEDDGIGLEKEELERVFDRFYAGKDSLHHGSGTYQFKARGAGLGLSVAKGYVEAHGGRIWAESEGPGRGSRFHVVLPAAEAAERGEAERAAS